MSERFLFQTPASEMQRRWDATLAAMEKEGLDAIIFGAYDRWCCGIAKYLTDLQEWNYPHYFIMSKKGISIFGMAGWETPGYEPYAATSEFFIDSIGIPTIPSTTYGTYWFPEEMTKIIKKYGYKRLGYAGFGTIPAPFFKYFNENLPECEFSDFTNTMDYIKAVKSAWEIESYTKCVYMHDQLMQAVPAILKPGMTERQVSTIIRAWADEIGCAELNLLACTDPVRPAGVVPYVYQNKVIGEQDYFYLLIELCGPGQQWAEVGRIFKLGDEPNAKMIKALNDQIEIADTTAKLMVPGAICSDVFKEINRMLVERGYAPEKRFCSHGQGCDIVDRPMFVDADDMPLQENMFIAHHPNTVAADCIGYNCDNWIITKEGAKILSKTPRTIFNIVNY